MLALLVPSPTSSRASTRATAGRCRRARGRWRQPTMPAPMTTTSRMSGVAGCHEWASLAASAAAAARATGAGCSAALVRGPRGFVGVLGRPGADDLVRGSTAGSRASRAQRRRAQRGGVCGRIDLDGDAGQVGLGLHEHARTGSARRRRAAGSAVGPGRRRPARPVRRPGRRCLQHGGTRCPRSLLRVMPVKDAVASRVATTGRRVRPGPVRTARRRWSRRRCRPTSSWSAAEISPRSMAHRTAEAAV